MKILGIPVPTLNLAKKTQPKPPNEISSKKRAVYAVKEQPRRQVNYEIKDIYAALYMATRPQDHEPDRSRLLSIYDYILNDGHLSSQIEQARMKVLSEPFSLFKDKKADEKTTRILQAAWFENILNGILDAEFFGFTLLDAFPLDGKLDVVTIPRINVSPDDRFLLIDGHVHGKKFPYAGLEEKLNLMHFGRSKDMGTLLNASFNVIFKYYSRSDWSRASEKFGMPMLHIKANTNQESELDRIELKAAAFGTDGFLVTQSGDEATIVERKGQDMHKIYLDNITYCDEQISKIINGQTGTSDEKAFVGSAEVHERMQNTFTISRLRRIKYGVNDIVIPRLVSLGMIPEGLEFDYMTFLNEEQSSGKPPSNLNTKGDPKQQSGKTQLSKKKLNSGSIPILNKFPHRITLSGKLNLIDSLIQAIYDHKSSPEKDSDFLFQNTYTRLRQGVDKGCKHDWFETGYGSTTWELQKNLRYNVGVFSAFKRHDEVDKMVKALRDDDGNLREFPEFKKIASQISFDYNVNWLKTEYTAAVRSSQTAVDWQKAVKNKHLYPNIEYTPSRAAIPREEHKDYYGIIRPVDDPFWDTHLPPTGWGCKCGWRPTRSPETDIPSELPPVPKAFAHNPGKTGKVFDNGHAFFKMGEDYARVADLAKHELMRFESKELLDHARANDVIGMTIAKKNVVRKIEEAGRITDQRCDISIAINRNSFDKNLGHTASFWNKVYILHHIETLLKKATFSHYETNKKPADRPLRAGMFVFKTRLNNQVVTFKIEDSMLGTTSLYWIDTK